MSKDLESIDIDLGHKYNTELTWRRRKASESKYRNKVTRVCVFGENM